MNSLYTLGVRQTTAIQADLDRMKAGDNSVPLQGQISASLAALNRTVDDYDSLAKRELVKAKQEKATSRVQKFRLDYAELRSQFDAAKAAAGNERLAASRAELIGPDTPTPRQRFQTTQNMHSESPFANPPSNSFGPTSSLRQAHALEEHSFIQETENQLDSFIAQGREVLDNLVDQRNILKGTQKRLLDAANTLGLSRNVIGWIEKRTKEDTIIFVIGAVFTLFCFWLIWRYLG